MTRSCPVGHTRCVSKVKDRFVRELSVELSQNGETTDTAVENTNATLLRFFLGGIDRRHRSLSDDVKPRPSDTPIFNIQILQDTTVDGLGKTLTVGVIVRL